MSFASLTDALNYYSKRPKLEVGDYSLEAVNVIFGNYGQDLKLLGKDVYLSPEGLRAISSLYTLLPFPSPFPLPQ